MRRRRFVQGLPCFVLTSWAADVGAQTTKRKPKVGFLSPSAPGDMDLPTDLVRAALTSLGYVDGQTITIEIRFADNKLERLPALAAELVATQPDVIHAFSSAAIHALAAATSTIPIIVAPVTEATLAEFVGDPSHPKGNVTGLTLDSREQSEKCLQLLKEAAPHITRVGVLRNPLNSAWRRYPEMLNDAARALGIDLVDAEARGLEEIDRAFEAMVTAGADALFVPAESTFVNRPSVLQRIVEQAAKKGLPSTSHSRFFTRGGGLLSLSSHAGMIARGAAFYVHRVLQGAKPGELPVVNPTQFELIVNLRTAKILGIELPSALLARAEEVIE